MDIVTIDWRSFDRPDPDRHPADFHRMFILQSAMVAAEGKTMLDLPTQHKLGILQGFVVEMDTSSTMTHWAMRT